MLCGFSWPGKVRQLENSIENAVALSGDRLLLLPADFAIPYVAPKRQVMEDRDSSFVALPDEGLDFEGTVARIELHLLEQALRRTNGNKTQAAEILGLKRTTLSAKLRSLAYLNV